MADRNTYALLSTRVYEASVGTVGANEIFLPAGWSKISQPVDNGLTGLYAQAFRNDVSGEVVIAFRGTDGTISDGTIQDWKTNIATGLSIPNGQVAQAMTFYENIKAAYGTNGGSNISFTGHSLGGGLASLMAVFFDKKATVFDTAPFQLTAVNPATVAAYGLAAPSALLDLDFLEYATTNPLSPIINLIFRQKFKFTFDIREENVTHYYLEGEALDNLRGFQNVNAIVGDAPGKETEYDLGQSTADAIDRHDLPVLTAAQYSLGFLNALQKLPNLFTQLLDKNLYAAARNSPDQDILSLLLRHQFGNGTTVPADGMLDGFARDLSQLTPGGLIKDAAGLENALITALLQGYDKLGLDSKPFTTDFYQGRTGGFSFDIGPTGTADGNLAASFSAIRTATDITTALQSYYVLDPTLALDGFERYTMQAGPAGLLSTDTEGKSDLMAGGSRIDALQAGAGDDLLLGGAGGDLLAAGTGTDQLIGSAGHDLYIIRPAFGTVTISDADQSGEFVHEDASGTPPRLKDVFMYYTDLPLAA
jgi:hypothetical protein